jgi:hypothetical protein
MLSLQKTALALKQIKNLGIQQLETMAQLERQSLASPSSVKVHLELFESALTINKIDVMKGLNLAAFTPRCILQSTRYIYPKTRRNS